MPAIESQKNCIGYQYLNGYFVFAGFQFDLNRNVPYFSYNDGANYSKTWLPLNSITEHMLAEKFNLCSRRENVNN